MAEENEVKARVSATRRRNVLDVSQSMSEYGAPKREVLWDTH